MTFTAPVKRTWPEGVGGEAGALDAWLDAHRATLLLKLDGLDEDQLRRSVTPTGFSLLGLVKHLAHVEHSWFVLDFAGSDEPDLFGTGPGVFAVTPDESTSEIVDTYLAACARSRRIVAEAESLDQAVPHVELGTVDLRWIMIHMIEETARHNGHADIIRELIDGSTGL